MTEHNLFDIDNSRESKLNPTVSSTTPNEENVTSAQTLCANKVDKAVSIAYASVLLAFHVVLLVFLLCGCVQFNGRNVDIIYAFNLIVNIFSVTYATVYKSVIGGIMAVVFFVFVVLFIIRIVRSIRIFIKVIQSRNDATSLCSINLSLITKLFDNFMVSLVNTFIFIVASNLFGVSEITVMAIILMVLGGVSFVTQGVLDYFYHGKTLYNNKFGLSDFILITIKRVILYITMMLIIGFLNKTAGKDFLYGAQKMFNGNVFGDSFSSTAYSLYVNLIEPVLFVVITIRLLMIIVNRICQATIVENGTLSKVTSTIVLIAVTMVLHLICRVIIVNSATSFEISMIWYWLQLVSSTYIPLLLLSIILHLISTFCQVSLSGDDNKEPIVLSNQSACQQNSLVG